MLLVVTNNHVQCIKKLQTSISIGGRMTCSLLFAVDMALIAEGGGWEAE